MVSTSQSPNAPRSKREQLVEAALRLFQREGYRATGIERILSEAGVAKMTLYHHFTSKDELILAALRLSDERFRGWLARRVRELGGAGEGAARRRLLAVFDAAGEWFESEEFRGCPFARACSEFAETDHPAHCAAAEHQRLMRRYFVDLCSEAGALDAEWLGEALLILFTGATAAAQVRGDAEVARTARAAARVVIDGELGRRTE